MKLLSKNIDVHKGIEIRQYEVGNTYFERQALKSMQNKGWKMQDIQHKKGQYDCCLGMIMGIIFLPLAVLGMRSGTSVVTLTRKVSK